MASVMATRFALSRKLGSALGASGRLTIPLKADMTMVLPSAALTDEMSKLAQARESP